MQKTWKNVHVVDHPLVMDSLTHLRNKDSGLPQFRYHSDKICSLLFAESIRGLSFQEVKIETPLKKMKSPQLSDEIVVVPVLRAGLAMLFGAIQLLPKSKIGFVGLSRNEETAIAQQYYWKLPAVKRNSVVIVVDPMLATGGSIVHVLEQVAKQKPKEIRVVCVVAAVDGLKAVQKKFPNIQIFTAAIDPELNEKKYIVPGLGDYGDRYFGTT